MENFDKDFRNILNLEGVRYFYHITDMNPDTILEEGLYLVQKDIYTTAIEIPEEFKNNPTEYIENEKGNFYRNNPKVIIIAVEDEKFDDLLVDTNQIPDNWTQIDNPTCLIPSSNILGYIDSEELNIVLNDNYDLSDELHYHY